MRWTPMQQRKNVLLPAPLGPIIQWTFPGSNFSVTHLTGVTPPKRFTIAFVSNLPFRTDEESLHMRSRKAVSSSGPRDFPSSPTFAYGARRDFAVMSLTTEPRR